jgi:hypothetical protein
MTIVSGSCFASELTYNRFLDCILASSEELPRTDFVLDSRKFYLRLILYYGATCIFPLCGAAFIVSTSNAIDVNAIDVYVSLFSVAGAHRAMSSGTQMPGVA